MGKEKSLILDQFQIEQKTKRIAFEIYESNFKEDALIIAGICDQGYQFAKELFNELEKISPFALTLVRIELDKEAPMQCEVKLDVPMDLLTDKCVIIVDDVLNTGRTMAYSLKPFLNQEIRKLETAVLVNRSHKLFPISANYNGYELSTSIHEHIEVNLKDQQKSVFLS
ncbi:MAG: phosphoribosyltransferase family protein [Cyclobacteriaceae bacterium]